MFGSCTLGMVGNDKGYMDCDGSNVVKATVGGHARPEAGGMHDVVKATVAGEGCASRETWDVAMAEGGCATRVTQEGAVQLM
ncbi:hypothetical protein GUJ93_ZPchr0016g2630 [Zizania palustris]|uniref:Uncharacterized protein n=1 Tax=Zizania palustris TaxID=103762 RepID=A0A8J5TM20_ZIZPA|nr:hypothetical protein GUJ93_ZPchr0016g2630 [Zizania palustris]